MKFQRIKDVCLGATVAALVMGAAPAAYAKVANMDIPVMFSNIKIVVDGKELKTDNLLSMKELHICLSVPLGKP